MKITKQQFRFVVFLACLAVALSVAGLVQLWPAKTHGRHSRWQDLTANTRTVMAAVRYLLDPGFPPVQNHGQDPSLAGTNGPKTVQPARQPIASLTNLTGLTISNGVATEQAACTVPG